MNKNSSPPAVMPLVPPYFYAMQQLFARWPAQSESHLMLAGAETSRFSCSGCGACCRKSWRIPVSQAYYDQWYAHFHQHPSRRFSEPFSRLPAPNPQNFADIRRQADGISCIFLKPDQRCFIHENYGVEALPEVCQIFPRQEYAPSPYYGVHEMRWACEDILPIWQSDQTLYAHFRSGAPGVETAERPSGCLLLASCLDVMVQNINTPFQRLSSLVYLLEILSERGHAVWPQVELTSLYREQLRLSAEPIWSGPACQQLTEIPRLLLPFLPVHLDIRQQFLAWLHAQPFHLPALEETERQQLTGVLQSFLIRQLLKLNFEAGQGHARHLIAPFFFSAARAVLLQMFTIFYARLESALVTSQHIQKSLSLLDQYLSSDQLLWEQLQLERFTAAQILNWARQVLLLDCGHCWPVLSD